MTEWSPPDLCTTFCRAANSSCPPVVILPKKLGPNPNWETAAVLWE